MGSVLRRGQKEPQRDHLCWQVWRQKGFIATSTTAVPVKKEREKLSGDSTGANRLRVSHSRGGATLVVFLHGPKGKGREEEESRAAYHSVRFATTCSPRAHSFLPDIRAPLYHFLFAHFRYVAQSSKAARQQEKRSRSNWRIKQKETGGSNLRTIDTSLCSILASSLLHDPRHPHTRTHLHK